MSQSASDEKTERQLALVLLLRNANRPLTRDEIRDAIGEYQGVADAAFERSFERDKKDLREIGMQISLVESVYGEPAYIIRGADATLLPLELDETERLALSLAARAWGSAAAWDAIAHSGLGKLEAAGEFDVPSLDSVQVTTEPGSDLVEAALEAIEERRSITFAYGKPREATPAVRTVDPWAVVALRGRWYLVGRDRDRGEERSFRLSRVMGRLKPKGERHSFNVPSGFDPRHAIRTEFGDTVDATVLVAPGTGHAIRALGAVVAGPGGWDRVEVRQALSDRLTAEVLRAGSAAVVDEPEWLRAEIMNRLRRVAEEPDHASAPSAEDIATLRKLDRDRQGSKPTATVRLARLLSIIPWLRAHPGASLSGTALHFGMSEDDLRRDLVLAGCTEFGPWHTTIDIDLGRTTVVVREAHGVDAPPPLSGAEVAALLLGLRLLADVAWEESADLVAGLERKLTQAAADKGATLRHVSVVDEARGKPGIPGKVLAALQKRQALRLTYWSAIRDVVSERTVDPVRMWRSDGITYLTAWCREAHSMRSFRIDRILACEILPERASVPPDANGTEENETASAAILLVERDGAWLAEYVRNARSARLPDGRLLLACSVESDAWAVRTVMSLGGRARVIEPQGLSAAVRAAAVEALAGYGSEAPWTRASSGPGRHS